MFHHCSNRKNQGKNRAANECVFSGRNSGDVMKQQAAMIDQAPLISPRFVWKLTAAIAVLCLLTAGISLSGRFLGKSMLLAGHTTDETPLQIVIGNDVLILPTNVVRFEKARRSGIHDAIDTYFTWPGMKGYTDETRDRFSQIDSLMA